MDVTVAGGGIVGGDAERDDFARIAGTCVGLRKSLTAFFSVLKHMVGGEHGDDRLRIVGRRPGGAPPAAAARPAPARLEQDHRLGDNLLQLLGDAEAVVKIGDDDRGPNTAGSLTR